MKLLKNILFNVDFLRIVGSVDIEINELNFDSRQIHKNDVFIAQKGVHSNGHLYIDQAIAQGASVVICQDLPTALNPAVTYIHCENSSKTLGIIASNFYDCPSEHLKLIGITGTNGKTTTATLLYKLFQELGYKCGLISTIKNYIDTEIIPTTHTTPDAIELNYLLSMMVEKQCEYCFMEVSSHAIVQNRIAGLKFKGGVFSNLTHDHLDFHKTFEAYRDAKKTFFDMLPKDAFALSNVDDKNGIVMLQNTQASIYTYSLRQGAYFRAKLLDNTFEGLNLEIDHQDVWFKLTGGFNAYNLLAVYGTAILLNQERNDVLRIMSELTPTEGRFQYYINKEHSIGIVDYAHTPDALENVLKNITEITRHKVEIITVVGCGGDRDPFKRPIMAKIACQYSDKIILTSDNPRTEDPFKILDDMKKGLSEEDERKVITMENRKEAIKTGCFLLHAGSVLLIAGKGHETYQEIQGVRHHFDDREELLKYL